MLGAGKGGKDGEGAGREAQEEHQGHTQRLCSHGAVGREAAREGKPLQKADPNAVLPYLCQAVMPALPQIPLPSVAFAEGAWWCQQARSGALFLQVSAAPLPSLFVSPLPAGLTALLEAIIPYTNLILALDELKTRTSHLPPPPTDFFRNLKEAARK